MFSCIYVQVYTIIHVCMHPSKKIPMYCMYCMYACMYGHNVCSMQYVHIIYQHACIQTTHAQMQTWIHVNTCDYTPVYICMLTCVHTHLPANQQTHKTNKNAYNHEERTFVHNLGLPTLWAFRLGAGAVAGLVFSRKATRRVGSLGSRTVLVRWMPLRQHINFAIPRTWTREELLRAQWI